MKLIVAICRDEDAPRLSDALVSGEFRVTRVASTGGFLKRGKAQPATPRRLYPSYRTLEAMASRLPLGLARGLLAYLDGFPTHAPSSWSAALLRR